MADNAGAATSVSPYSMRAGSDPRYFDSLQKAWKELLRNASLRNEMRAAPSVDSGV
jgi:hypothetical protein